MKKLYNFIIFTLIFFFLNCSNRMENNLMGKWKLESTNVTYEFFKDGSFATYQSSGITKGHYSFQDDETIKINWDAFLMPMFTAKSALKKTK